METMNKFEFGETVEILKEKIERMNDRVLERYCDKYDIRSFNK